MTMIEIDPKQCDFRAIKGLILKTVDSVHENVRSHDQCKEICLNAPYRCYSYDFGADSEPTVGGVCRTSHLNTGGVLHIEQPFVEMPGAVTYQLVSCLNVSVQCNAHEMVAKVRTNRIFNGKIYSRTKPNSCMNDVTNKLNFEISLPYNDLMCDVRHESPEKFTTDIVIQHHDRVVTQSDLGLSVLCRFDLANRTITNTQIEIDGSLGHPSLPDGVIQATTVHSPNVSMRIADMDGNPIQTAHVGDSLTLMFEIVDSQSPYEMFVRELVAVDGVDSSEMLLIDSSGCPTDLSIMSPITKLSKSSNAKRLKTTFEAFKFPASNIVQFRALITPCLSSCKPVQCNLISSDTGLAHEMVSYGKRKRRSVSMSTIEAQMTTPLPLSTNDDDVVVVGTIKITDAFNFKDSLEIPEQLRKLAKKIGRKSLADFEDRTFFERNSACTDLVGLIVACCVFLFAQLVLIAAWYYMWQRIKRRRQLMARHQLNQTGNHHMQVYPQAPMSTSSLDQLAAGHYAQNLKYNDIMAAKVNQSFYEM